MTQDEIIYEAVREVCHTNDPKTYLEHNQTVDKVARKVVYQMNDCLLDIILLCVNSLARVTDAHGTPDKELLTKVLYSQGES